jgi:hypothetical protein
LAAQVTPYKRDAVLISGAKAFVSKGGSVLKAAGALERFGVPGLIPDLVTEEEALKSREIFLKYIDGLGARGDWAQVDRLLGHPSLPIQPIETALYRAHASQKENQARIAALQWEQAIELAGSNAAALLRVADYARRAGADKISEQACRKVIECGGESRRQGFEGLLRLRGNDLPGAFEVLSEMAAAYPSDLTVQNDLTYSALLLNKSPKNAVAGAEALVKQRPELLACRTTLALAWLKAGSAGKAKAAMEAAGSDWRRFRPYQMAVYAAACGAAGDANQAMEIASNIDAGSLKREERELASRWL